MVGRALGLGVLLFSANACFDVPGNPARESVGSQSAQLTSEEIEVDSPVPRPLLAAAVRSIASDGASFLAVWSEADELWAARFDLAGQPMQPVSHPLGITVASDAVIEFDGTSYVLAWADSEGVKVGKLTSTGEFLGSPQLVAVLDPASEDAEFSGPDIAVGQDNLLVAWAVRRENLVNDHVRGQLLNASLDPVGDSFDIHELRSLRSPRVASDGLDYFVAWEDPDANAIRGSGVSAQGEVLDPGALALTPGSHSVNGAASLIYGDGAFLVAWASGSGNEVFARRFNNSEGIIDAMPLAVTAGQGSRSAYPLPQATYDGTQFVVSWIDDRAGDGGLYASWLKGEALEPAGGLRVIPGVYRAAAAASDGQMSILAYGAKFGLFDASPQALLEAPQPMAWRFNGQFLPSMCPVDTGFLVVWRDDRTEPGLYAARISHDGQLQGADAVHRIGPHLVDHDLACGNSAHMVVWHRLGPVKALRIDDDGAPLDAEPIEIVQSTGAPPAVGASGSEFLVVWTAASEVRGRRVAEDGTVIDEDFLVLASQSNTRSPTVAFGDGTFLVAWSNSFVRKIFGARVDRFGGVIELSAPIGEGSEEVTIAHGEPGFLVTWPEFFAKSRLISPAGQFLSEEEIILDVGARIEHVQGSWDGQSFVVATEADGGAEILMTRVDSGGLPISKSRQVVVSGEPGSTSRPQIAALDVGEYLLLFERVATLGSRAISRLRLRTFSLAPTGTECTGASICESGLCVDGVCCNEACGGGDSGDCQACSVAAGAALDGTCAPISSGTVCRPAAYECDGAEVCDGINPLCPEDVDAEDGTECSDGDACTEGDVCTGGLCSGEDVECPDPSPCMVGICESSTGQCGGVPVEDGTECDPNDRCVVSGSCLAGSCAPGEPVQCPDPPECHEALGCNPDTGECDVAPVADGQPCSRGFCQSGGCVEPPEPPDAGVPDAVTPDAAATADAQPASDASVDSRESSSGCRIASSREGTPDTSYLLFVLALLALLRRRRG